MDRGRDDVENRVVDDLLGREDLRQGATLDDLTLLHVQFPQSRCARVSVDYVKREYVQGDERGERDVDHFSFQRNCRLRHEIT